MGTGMRLFIASRRLGRGHFCEALKECLRSPSDKIFGRELRLEVGRPAQADVGHLKMKTHEPISWKGLVSRPSRQRKEAVSTGG